MDRVPGQETDTRISLCDQERHDRERHRRECFHQEVMGKIETINYRIIVLGKMNEYNSYHVAHADQRENIDREEIPADKNIVFERN